MLFYLKPSKNLFIQSITVQNIWFPVPYQTWPTHWWSTASKRIGPSLN